MNRRDVSPLNDTPVLRKYAESNDRLEHRQRVITDVIYRTYEETTPESAMSEGAGWMHGEVLLVFPNVPKLFIGWGENEGWPDQFSLHPSETTTYEPGTLVDLPALDAPEWLPVREQVLTAAELRGSNGTPHLIVLHFGSDGVVIGEAMTESSEMATRSWCIRSEAQLSEFRTDLLNDVTFL